MGQVQRPSTGALGKAPEGAIQSEIERPSRPDFDFEDFFENGGIALHLVGGDGTILHANRAELELLGYSAADYIGHHIGEFHADQHVIEDILARLNAGETLRNYPARLIARDGSIKEVEITSSAQFRDGKFINMRCFSVDVTALKSAQEDVVKRMEEQAALSRFTDRLYRAESISEVYEAALNAILSALRCNRASILRFDEAGVMRFVAWRGLSDRYRSAVEGHSPWKPGDKDPHPIFVDDIDASDEPESLKRIVTGEGIRALAFIPLVADGGVTGKFMTYYEAPHAFTADEIDLAVTIARHLGLSIERRRAEESLREREARRTAIVETALDGIITINHEGKIVEFNAAAERIFGYQRGEVVGRAMAELIIPPHLRQKHFQGLARYLATGEASVLDRRLELAAMRRNGTEFPVELSITRVLMAGPPLFTGYVRDITERRRAELARRDSEQRLQLALEAGRMGAWEWDIASGKVIWSPSLEQIHGLKPGTFGGNFEDFKRDIHPDDLQSALGQIQQALETRQDYHVVYRMLRPDGAVRWLEAFGRFVHGADERQQKLAGVCVDITERRQAEEQREFLVAELNHRVKNTLATVISIAQQSFAQDSSFEAARRSFESRICALAQTHSRLAEANWSGVSFETMLLDELAPFRREDGGNIELFGPSIKLNPKSAVVLGIAFHELATNAAKYGALSTRGGVVNVSWEASSPDAELAIRWIESGGPPVRPPQRSGFGRRLLERAIASDLDGAVQLDFAEKGLRCEIKLPLNAGVAATLM